MSRLEIAANLINVLSIFLAARNHILTWLTGIIGCLLFAVLFYEARLYADVSLQFFFIITSIIGWRRWLIHGKEKEWAISRVSRLGLGLAALGGFLAAMIYGALLHSLTNASYPFVDSMVLAFSVVAQLLLMNRKVENWYFWIIVNLISVPLYLFKELYLTAGLYALFLANGLWGLMHWRRSMTRAEI